VDEVAARIRAAAATAGVPVRSDPPTARAIHATVRIGHEILPDHYAPVAAAIRFAEAMRRRAGARHGR
jgi:flagellar biosynthetic protein FlhB